MQHGALRFSRDVLVAFAGFLLIFAVSFILGRVFVPAAPLGFGDIAAQATFIISCEGLEEVRGGGTLSFAMALDRQVEP